MKNWKNRAFGAFLAIVGIIVTFSACGNVDNEKIYNVTIGTLTNGSIVVNPTSGIERTEITLTVTPNNGYKLKTGTLKYGTTAINEATLKFNLPATNVIVTAEFELISSSIYNVTIGTLTNGSIVANPTSGIEGTEITLTVTPNNGYKLKTGTLKYGKTAINEATLKFNLPATNVIVTAEFELNNNSPTNLFVGRWQSGITQVEFYNDNTGGVFQGSTLFITFNYSITSATTAYVQLAGATTATINNDGSLSWNTMTWTRIN
jgi:hypothetical protein